MAIEAVIFDLDDTLCRRTALPDWSAVTALQVAELTPHCERLDLGKFDLTAFLTRFWTDFAATYDMPHRRPDDPIEELRWSGGPAMLQEALAQHSVACSEEDATCLWEALHEVPPQARNLHAYPDAHATLLTLRASGYRLALATARPESALLVLREMRKLDLPEVFEVVSTSGDVGYRKPHPLVFESAAEALGVPPERALLVGDSYENDIMPAAGLGMVAVLKLNERAQDPRWTLARAQVPTLTALLELDLLRRE